jgi:hypothetical protein
LELLLIGYWVNPDESVAVDAPVERVQVIYHHPKQAVDAAHMMHWVIFISLPPPRQPTCFFRIHPEASC